VFLGALRNTAAVTIPNVALRLLLSLLIALALNSRIRFRAFYRALFFMPVLTMPVATATIWKWMFDPSFGPINAQLGRLGLPQPEWLTHPETAIIAVVIVLLWSGVGYDMIIFLAGLQNIPREYYEAAQIDGAGAFRQFRDITLPLLTPTTFFLTVVAIIGSLQVFDLVYVMTRVGNINRFPTIVYYIYEEGFQNFRMGYAVTIAWVLLLIILVFTLLQFRLQRRWVHYA
jgi:multiple sugar transport system permease protein